MPEDRDYDLAIYKVPRKDKDGRDITGDKIGPGGRHRGNGTYSGVAYDPELLDENADCQALYVTRICLQLNKSLSMVLKSHSHDLWIMLLNVY